MQIGYMTQINSYLTFSGNCREAMTFTGNAWEANSISNDWRITTFRKMPEQMKDCILHSTLTRDGLVLMGSDMVGEGFDKGKFCFAFADMFSEEEIEIATKSLPSVDTQRILSKILSGELCLEVLLINMEITGCSILKE
jgi:PhnB protein